MSKQTTPQNTTSSAKSASKIDKIIALMRRKNGASLEEMVKATGWLPHTTHAALSGLRKKGQDIVRETGKARKSTYRFSSANSAAKAR